MTNRMLLSFHEEIQQVILKSVVGFLLRGKINEFYNEYSVRLKTIDDKIIALHKEFFVIENDQVKIVDSFRTETVEIEKEITEKKWFVFNVKRKVKVKEEKQIPEKQPVCLEGKTKEDFQKRYMELMNEEVGTQSKIITLR